MGEPIVLGLLRKFHHVVVVEVEFERGHVGSTKF